LINIKRSDKPFIGRKKEFHWVLKSLNDERGPQIINCYGHVGVGKEMFIDEIAYFMHSRNKFQDGIYKIDFKGIKTGD